MGNYSYRSYPPIYNRWRGPPSGWLNQGLFAGCFPARKLGLKNDSQFDLRISFVGNELVQPPPTLSPTIMAVEITIFENKDIFPGICFPNGRSKKLTLNPLTEKLTLIPPPRIPFRGKWVGFRYFLYRDSRWPQNLWLVILGGISRSKLLATRHQDWLCVASYAAAACWRCPCAGTSVSVHRCVEQELAPSNHQDKSC